MIWIGLDVCLLVIFFLCLGRAIKAQSKEEASIPPPVGDAFTNSTIKHLLLPVIDRNPYLSEGTRQVLLLHPTTLLHFSRERNVL